MYLQLFFILVMIFLYYTINIKMLLHNTTTKNIKNDLMQFIILSDNDFFKRYY